MRCLGRLISLFVLLVALAVAYLYRDELGRALERTLHPAQAIARVGHPDPAALASARSKLETMQNSRRDSVVLTADEMTSLLVAGTSNLPGATFDSLTAELGDGTVRVRTLVDSVRIPARLRALIPGTPAHYETVELDGALTPVRAGLAEFAVDRVAVHGVPLPVDMVARIAATMSGKPVGSRLDLVIPETVGGFRVHPDGVTIYREGGRP